MENFKHVQITRLKSFNWENAIHGIRHSRQSYHKEDSVFEIKNGKEDPILGPNDYRLATGLSNQEHNAPHHRKFMRQIFVSCDVTAPWYWWKQQETFQIGTVENSTSTMYTITKHPLTIDDFVIDHHCKEDLQKIIDRINGIIDKYSEYKSPGNEKLKFRGIIQLLPGSFKYTRACSMNYEVLANQYNSRWNHKLVEWYEYLKQMINELPYPELITQGHHKSLSKFLK